MDLQQPHAASDTRLKTAAAAGMSARQMHTALRVASVPTEVFTSLVEGEDPPRVPALANLGKGSRPSLDPMHPRRSPAQKVAFAISLTLRHIAVIADTNPAVHEALKAKGITAAKLRHHAGELLAFPARRVVRPLRGAP
jgi:hypothetical protein